MIQTLFRIIAYGIQGFRRNIWLSVIAIITMTLTLLTLTGFALGVVVISKTYQDFSQRKIDYAIILRDSASDIDISQLRAQIEQRSEVTGIQFESKEDSRKRFELLFGHDATLKGVISDDNNPLPRVLTVKFSDPSFIDGFNTFMQQDRFKEVIEKTSYQDNQSAITNYLRTTNFVKVLGLTLTIFFTLVAVLVLLNTIRLTIYSRRTEVEVMRFVGATQGYIRGPFLVEGVIFGLVSAVLAAGVSWFLLSQVEQLVQQTFAVDKTNVITDMFGSVLLTSDGQSSVGTVLAQLFSLQVSVGLLLGVLCSIFAVRRYLKE